LSFVSGSPIAALNVGQVSMCAYRTLRALLNNACGSSRCQLSGNPAGPALTSSWGLRSDDRRREYASCPKKEREPGASQPFCTMLGHELAQKVPRKTRPYLSRCELNLKLLRAYMYASPQGRQQRGYESLCPEQYNHITSGCLFPTYLCPTFASGRGIFERVNKCSELSHDRNRRIPLHRTNGPHHHLRARKDMTSLTYTCILHFPNIHISSHPLNHQ
jgi:hypothetical protein